ncbi:MAG: hypothetical protein IMY73_02035 [Bacteroidetes bacterium]|nr:hypothetical protein [Bacteroidota bacterium]
MKKSKLSLLLMSILMLVLGLNSCTLEDETTGSFDETLIIGKWERPSTITSGTDNYRYDSNHTGVTWDTGDDTTEAEGQKFKWEVDQSNLIHIHIMESGDQAVPKQYTLVLLTSTKLQYKDFTNKMFSFTKVK